MIMMLFLSYLMMMQPADSSPVQNGNVRLKFMGIDQIGGEIELQVFNAKKGFPTTDQSVLKSYQIKVNSTDVSFEISDLPYGEYAISCFLDKNKNGKLDTNFMGVPKEKVGTSNNPKGGGIPNYEDAKFNLFQPKVFMTIEMR